MTDHSSHGNHENHAVYINVGIVFVAVLVAIVIIAMLG